MNRGTFILFMKISVSFLTGLLALSLEAGAQATMTTTGNWDNAANWSGNNIGDLITEDVTINNTVNPTIQSPFSYTIGNLNLVQDNTLDINTGATLTLGASGNPKNLTTNLNANIAVAGTLEIWGNMVVNNNINLAVSGDMIIHGNLVLSDNANVSVSGIQLKVYGNLTGGTNVNFSVSSDVDVGGSVSVGSGSNLALSGTFHDHGGCSGPAAFCTGSLPVELLSFDAFPGQNNVRLDWVTASEINFDYFLVEKSTNGIAFSTVAKVQGAGTSRTGDQYSVVDEKPTFGKTYYRLTEVDMDHSIHYLKMLALDFTGEKAVTIYPNPVPNGIVHIDLNFAPDSDAIVSIIDLRGITLSEFQITAASVTVPVSVSSGTYLMRVRSRDFNAISRLVIR
jgi:Secretion system C-terminal sorting domain